MVLILNAISGTMILMLVAIGLAIIFGQMKVLNLAHGEFFMLGAYAAVFASILNLPPVAGILLAPVLVGAFGILVERTMIRPLYHRPLDTLLVTWGLAIVLRQLVQLSFGAVHRNVEPVVSGTVSILGVNYPVYRIFIIGVTVVLLVMVYLLFYKTSFGLRMRMVIQNREQASAMGINTASLDRWTFAVGSALCGIAGAIVTPIMFINPFMGTLYLTNSFIIVIIGGVEKILGIIGGGLVIGASRSIIDYFIKDTFFTQIIVLFLAIVVIRLKPGGLFSRNHRTD